MKGTYVDGKKLAKNGRKTATYYAASFLPHYRRVLFSHLLVFNLCILHGNIESEIEADRDRSIYYLRGRFSDSFNTLYMSNSTLVSPVKMESG